MGEPDCCLSCKTAASATIGNRPLRIRTVGGVVGRREYPHASYPIKLAAMNWGDGITVDARRAAVSPAMPARKRRANSSNSSTKPPASKALKRAGSTPAAVPTPIASPKPALPSLTVLPLPVAASTPNANTSASTRSKTACACSRASCPFSKKNRSKQVKG